MTLTVHLRQTIVVIEPRVPTVRDSATVAQLDVLELLRSGALAAYPSTAPAGTAEFLLPQIEDKGPALIELTDLEGVPVARMRMVDAQNGSMAQGEPTWLGVRSARPFENLHQPPDSHSETTGVVVFLGPVTRELALAAVSDAGARPLLLALVSLDGEPSPGSLDTARQVRDLALETPGARAIVVPAPALFGRAEVDAVIASYAHGQPVRTLPADYTEAASGTVVFFTGLSGSGKSTLARSLRNRLLERGQRATLLDGDLVRRHLSAGLGFSPTDRDTNIRRIGWVAAEIAYHGGIAICSPIAPYEHTRQAVRQLVEQRGARFVLVHVATPLEECERRDRKGLYARARRGEIPDFTGVTAPYEEPDEPALRIDTTGRDVDSLVAEIWALLHQAATDAG